jgi:site-specific DNA-methyltransferase (adenine-specific)
MRDSIGFAHDDSQDAAPLLSWCFGNGFPKSQDVSKQLDKLLGHPRAVVSKKVSDRPGVGTVYGLGHSGVLTSEVPNTREAARYQGFSSALKPAWEPVILVRKPLSEKTLATNVLKYGTGALNIDGCRVGTEVLPEMRAGQARLGTFERTNMVTPAREGRYPANVITDGSDAVVSLFPRTGPSNGGLRRNSGGHKSVAMGFETKRTGYGHADAGGSAARFFYSAKTSRRDRDEGLEHLPTVESVFPGANTLDADGNRVRKDGSVIPPLLAKNHHPTVKPTALMRYLVRLVTPPGGTVLDPFAGSGSTGKAAVLEGFQFIGMELSVDYAHIARARIAHATKSLTAKRAKA